MKRIRTERKGRERGKNKGRNRGGEEVERGEGRGSWTADWGGEKGVVKPAHYCSFLRQFSGDKVSRAGGGRRGEGGEDERGKEAGQRGSR